jgi:hypothetical protein
MPLQNHAFKLPQTAQTTQNLRDTRDTRDTRHDEGIGREKRHKMIVWKRQKLISSNVFQEINSEEARDKFDSFSTDLLTS